MDNGTNDLILRLRSKIELEASKAGEEYSWEYDNNGLEYASYPYGKKEAYENVLKLIDEELEIQANKNAG
mgnify:CR=1 FL=1